MLSRRHLGQTPPERIARPVRAPSPAIYLLPGAPEMAASHSRQPVPPRPASRHACRCARHSSQSTETPSCAPTASLYPSVRLCREPTPKVYPRPPPFLRENSYDSLFHLRWVRPYSVSSNRVFPEDAD